MLARVFSSHHRPHRFALIQQQLGDRASYRAYAAGRASNQDRIWHVFFSYAFSKSKDRFVEWGFRLSPRTRCQRRSRLSSGGLWTCVLLTRLRFVREDPVPFSFLLTLLEPLETAPCRSSCGRKPRQLFRADKFRSWAARLLAGRSSVCPRKQRAVLPPNPEWFCCQR
jgi:hypothetical protein